MPQMQRLREQVMLSIRAEYSHNEARKQGYDQAVGGDIVQYVWRMMQGREEARVQPLCLYHISKLTGCKVYVWSPHMEAPVIYDWGTEIKGPPIHVSWVHRAGQGQLNHFRQLHTFEDALPPGGDGAIRVAPQSAEAGERQIEADMGEHAHGGDADMGEQEDEGAAQAPRNLFPLTPMEEEDREAGAPSPPPSPVGSRDGD